MGLSLHVSEPWTEEDEGACFGECYVGSYNAFHYFRTTVAFYLDERRFPTLMYHSDCEGEWTLAELTMLERELREISAAFRKMPPLEARERFEEFDARRAGAKSLYDCFRNADGENLVEAILALCAVARQQQLPITFT